MVDSPQVPFARFRSPPKPSRVQSRGVGFDQTMQDSIQQQYWKEHPELAEAHPEGLRSAYLEGGVPRLTVDAHERLNKALLDAAPTPRPAGDVGAAGDGAPVATLRSTALRRTMRNLLQDALIEERWKLRRTGKQRRSGSDGVAAPGPAAARAADAIGAMPPP